MANWRKQEAAKYADETATVGEFELTISVGEDDDGDEVFCWRVKHTRMSLEASGVVTCAGRTVKQAHEHARAAVEALANVLANHI